MNKLITLLLFLPFFVQAQPKRNYTLGIPTEPFISCICPTEEYIDSAKVEYFAHKIDSMLAAQVKTDTISVRVLCEHEKENGVVINHWLQVDEVRMERILEWETWWKFLDPDKDGFGYDVPVSDWVVKSTHYLDSIEGCYQLIPLKNDSN